jgi:hypothetical protein
MRSRILVSLALATPILAFGRLAHAENCGTIAASWNVPKGGAVFLVSGPGPITSVINGVGETRTHSMLSLGGSRVIHATMHNPPARDPSDDGFCSVPLFPDQLKLGQPGATNISTSAAYAYASGAVSITYQNGNIFGPGTINDDQGKDVANTANTFKLDPPITIALPPGPGRPPPPVSDYPHYLLLDGTNHAPYQLYQYMWPQLRNLGWVPSVGDGVVCSTLLSFFQGRLASGGGFGAPDTIDTHPYTHTATTNAGYALYDAVKSECQSNFEDSFWSSAEAYIYCGFRDPCAHAAAQVRNCMALGVCDDGDPDPFDAQVSNPSFAANSISPDWLAGYVSGQNWNGPHQSVWAKDYGHPVTWSTGGSTYACWD